jgi:hypothetical protein
MVCRKLLSKFPNLAMILVFFYLLLSQVRSCDLSVTKLWLESSHYQIVTWADKRNRKTAALEQKAKQEGGEGESLDQQG